jgi:predicted murein hydrolase (TIGR00659 family)
MPSNLAASPLLSLALTIITFQLATWLSVRSGRHPLCNPVLLSVCVLVAILTVMGVPYQRYFEGAQIIHVLLGPAVVALAVPLHRHLHKIRDMPGPILAAITAGAVMSAISASAIASLMGAQATSVVSVIPKSVTAPVAMGISEVLGGIPPLTAVLAVLTGILGASFGPSVLNLFRVGDPIARGLAMGTVSHGQGTARALEESEEAGAFSGLAMGLSALGCAFLLPLAAKLF